MTSELIESPTDYGLTLDEVEALQDLNNAFEVSIQTANTLRQAKLAAYDTKFGDRAALLSSLSSIAQRVYGDPSVDDNALIKAGFAPRPTGPTFVEPNTPTSLAVTLTDEATLTLTWGRNGNPGGTSFIIEQKIGGNWTLVGSVTASKFRMMNVEVGEKALFRVYAQRGNRKSAYSNQAVIWDTEGPGLSLAA